MVIFLSVDLAAPVSHVKFSEQGVGLMLELKQNVANTVACARMGMSQGDWNPFVKSKAENRCKVSLWGVSPRGNDGRWFAGVTFESLLVVFIEPSVSRCRFWQGSYAVRWKTPLGKEMTVTFPDGFDLKLWPLDWTHLLSQCSWFLIIAQKTGAV